MSSIRGDIFKGAVWLTSFKLIERGISVVSTLILVRLLLPEDFGLVAMAMSIIVAVEVFTSFGFDVVLIQNQQAKRSHYHTVWTFNFCLGLFVGGTIALAAYPISWFYQDDRLVLIMYAVAANYFLGNLESVGVVDFRKFMEFHKEVRYRLTIKIVGFIVTIPVAVVTGSYWSLIAGMTATNVAKVILSFWMKPDVPRITFARAKEIFGFSGWLMLNNALFTIVYRAQDFVVGRVLGARSLGLFNVSMEISNIISTEIVAPINRAAFPGYAKLSKDLEQFRQTYLDILACIMLLSLPAAVGISATAELFVPIVLGDSWLDSIQVIKVLALFGAVYSLSTNSIYIFHALAQPRKVTELAFLQVTVLLPALYYGTSVYGLLGAAWALLAVAAFVAVPVMWLMAARALKMSVFRILERWWRPLVGSAVMYFVVQWFVGLMAGGVLYSTFVLGLAVLLGIATFSSVVVGLWYVVGRPHGGESIVASQAVALLSRI